MKTSLINKTIQNATLIEKYIKKDLFEKSKTIVQYAEPIVVIDLLKENNNSTKKSLLEALEDENVYKTSLTVNEEKVIFIFKTQDWKGQEDYTIQVPIAFDDMNIYTLEYFYKIVTDYVNKNIEEIFDAVEREKKLEAINTFKQSMVA